MSEVDRLSNSGLFPVLPIADKHRDNGESAGKPPPDPHGNLSDPKAGDRSEPAEPRPPKSIIDEYA
jgi:hypothetical protein